MLAVVDLGGSRKAVGALAKVDLVDVYLEYFVLGEVVLDLEGEQGLIDLARQGFFRGKEEVARHLHGDGRGPLLLATIDEIGIRCAQDAQRVDAGMLVKALVFGGEDRLLHDGGHFLDTDEIAALFAEFADQVAVGGKDAQGDFGPVIGKHIDRRQLGVGKDEDDSRQGERYYGDTDQKQDRQEEPAQGRGQGKTRQPGMGAHYIGGECRGCTTIVAVPLNNYALQPI